MNRTVSVVRMQLINRQTYVWVPLLVLGGAFLLTLAIYAMLETSGITGAKYAAAPRRRCGTSASWACRRSRSPSRSRRR